MTLMSMNFSSRVRGVLVPSINDFRRVTLLAGALMAEHLREGDSAVDATAGTGADTCLLAQSVGAHGRVYAFDVQKEALKETEQRLSAEGLRDRVLLFHRGHETMGSVPELRQDSKIMGIMFNLGYLPHGDKEIVTKTDTTLAALESSVTLLAPKGLLTLCLYRHPAGLDESRAVEKWCAQLGAGFNVHKLETINKNNPPYLILAEKTK
ncbi:MAG: hypothetical protein EUB_02449 [Eubacterium sp.]